MSKQKEKIGKYVLDKELGKGAFGVVFKAIDGETGKIWAIKRLRKKDINSPKLKSFLDTEVAIMKEITHPNILKLEEMLVTDTDYYLVVQFCNQGDFENYMEVNKKQRLDENEAVGFLKQIMNGFQELRKRKILHRDFKLANLFLNDGVLIIGDFGLAKKGIEMTSTKVGTPLNMAPELLFANDGQAYNSKADLWSIGCVYYQMLFGEPPFFGLSIAELGHDIKKKAKDGIPFPLAVSEQSKDLIKQLLRMDPKERIEWDAFFNHPLFNKTTSSKLDNFSTVFQALKSMAINTNQIDEEFERNKKILTQQQNQTQSTTNLIDLEDLPLNNHAVQPQAATVNPVTGSDFLFAEVMVDAENVRQNYVHEKNKISYLVYTVEKIRTLLNLPALRLYYSSLIEIGLLIAKKAFVLCECILSHLKCNSNFLGINAVHFENFIKSRHVAQVIEDFNSELTNVSKTFNSMMQIQQTFSSSITFVESIKSPSVDLRVLDKNIFDIYRWMLDRTLELNDVLHISQKHDLVGILVFIKNAIYSQSNFPLVPNALFPDFKFSWEDFYNGLGQMKYQQAIMFLQS
jgi:serine/threonine protein kinase